MTTRMRPLLPRTGPLPPEGESKKRKRVACDACREKKTACDNAQPVCAACDARQTECRYTTKSNSETQLQVLKREHKRFKGLVEHLRTVPDDTAQAILHELRNSANPMSVLERYENGQILTRPSERTTALSALPVVHSETELRLMVQHPAAYPALDLSRDAMMSKNTVLESARVLAFDLPSGSSEQPRGVVSRGGLLQTPPSSHTGSLDAGILHGSNDGSRTQLHSEVELTGENETTGASTSEYFAPLLAHLRIGFWTSVSATDHYAASAISLYLETDHSTLRLFDAAAFLTDLINFRNDNCSAFLVSCLLAFASQTYTTKDAAAAMKSYEFEKEARALWRAETEDSVPTVAGLMLLFLSLGSHGKGSGEHALEYLLQASEMVKRMRMFGVKNTLDAEQTQGLTDEAQRALATTAWGVFNLYTLCVHSYVALPVEHPPAMPIPQDSNGWSFDDKSCEFVRSRAMNTLGDEVFMYMCKLCRFDMEALAVYRDPSTTRAPSLAFALARYTKHLHLLDNLPDGMQRSRKTHTTVLIFHMIFHMFVTDLFRPFISSERGQDGQPQYPKSSDPEAIFAASVKQLKGLIIEYTSHRSVDSHGIMWHTTLLYVANAVLKNTSELDWSFYFLLCIHCYSKLNDSYSFAEGAMQSLLAMAVNHSAISRGDAANIMKALLYEKKSGKGFERQTGDHVADLDLAMRDREAASTAVLAERFEAITIFDEFTEGVL